MVKTNNPLIIAGPCAIESKNQFFNIVDEIYTFTDIIRAGVWKGRTSPNDYSGVGERGLNWAQKVQNKYSIPVAIEVGTTKHIELALNYNIKILWIGARTTANPFAIQEIAESLKGVDAEIWVKNPIIADVKLWAGAIDRLKNLGIKKLKTIHRGFYSDKKNNLRNDPKWDLLYEFQKIHPDLPIISDPSHIAGNSKYIEQISKQAMQKNINKFMIEVHNFPHKALSDKQQQISPKEFKILLKKLKIYSR
ncbi:MAG: hypothetical protein CMP49_05210 [Flavobacteriales bacterium]|jgi:chorismate mutase|nr:hypothetical protein [Flavobacteriales bacterium]|tara:strand:+ start:533 stop:1282 length:750 start_codon:yes stop_codon:yes gene_type:complete